MLNFKPLTNLAKELNDSLEFLPHDDVLLPSKDRKVYELKPSNFRKISPANTPIKIAFVDGGNGTITKSPNFTISFNRVYYCIFQGKKQVHNTQGLTTDFFSCIQKRVKGAAKNGIIHDIILRMSRNSHNMDLPDSNDITAALNNVTFDDPRIDTLPRSLAEWRLGMIALDALSDGDVLVMDGSLTTPDKIESRYANAMFEKAQSKNVTVCAISKTSRLLTRSGEPLLNRVSDISQQTGYDRWRINVADGVSPHDPGFVMVVKLHPAARFSFRFEILQEQHQEMDDARINNIMASLATNSQDLSFLGYPYGLVVADRFAQVRKDDIKIYTAMLESRIRTGNLSKIMEHTRILQAHDRLNEVTS
ncbi:MAG: DNA double-strand break repair nuclease NurA [Cenarchaeum sp. SB0678_bin_8]|nr:DNA double-strand break repair nuclease NurA [Cenarchaeum sp. SB0666_bin_15]MYB46284.1 DNA double-strand break repair nuclease NurA [Cenarchaeum sp. SB0662_bin_33]MYD58530.1 DNA double-strand break repair nuclease NurA [Cenarchaeum sp. SB0678_bin_8]